MEGDLYPLLADDLKRAIGYYKMDYFLTKIKKHPSGFYGFGLGKRNLCGTFPSIVGKEPSCYGGILGLKEIMLSKC